MTGDASPPTVVAPGRITLTHGVIPICVAAMLWGTTGTAQSLVPAQLSPYWVGALRLAAASVFFAVWLLARDRRGLRPGNLIELPWPTIVAAAACICAYNLAFFAGVRATGIAAGTALALGSGPLWAGLLQTLVFRRAPSPKWWTATAIAVAGGVLLVWQPVGVPALNWHGIVLCLTAGLAYAAYALINERLVARVSPAIATGTVFTLAAVVALPAALAVAGPVRLLASDLVVIGWLGVFATGIAYLLFSQGLRHVAGATAVTLALIEPVTAFGLAVVVAGEQPSAFAYLGLIAVIAGLSMLTRAEHR